MNHIAFFLLKVLNPLSSESNRWPLLSFGQLLLGLNNHDGPSFNMELITILRYFSSQSAA